MEGWEGLEATELGLYQQEIGIKAIRMLIEPENS